MKSINELNVSTDVIKAAEKYADSKEGWLTPAWLVRYNSFLAGAYFQKPIEHTQLPTENKS